MTYKKPKMGLSNIGGFIDIIKKKIHIYLVEIFKVNIAPDIPNWMLSYGVTSTLLQCVHRNFIQNLVKRLEFMNEEASFVESSGIPAFWEAGRERS